MFRRRRFMRPFRRGFAPDVPPLLLQANRSMQTGDYQSAAEAFEQLARLAPTGRRHRGPIFLLQAGIARIQNHQVDLGMDNLKQGFSQFARAGEGFRYHSARRSILQELMERGYAQEAEDLEKYLNEQTPLDSQAPQEAEAPKNPILPTHCPSCGAAVRPGEVEWLDDMTAECAYCGSPIRST